MKNEIRLVKEKFPTIPENKTLELGTKNGTKTLRSSDLGTIGCSFKGDIVGIRISNGEAGSYSFLSNTNSQVEFVIMGGKSVYKKC